MSTINKFGFEREFFVKQKGEYVEVPSELYIHRDECFYLVEARGEPHSDPRKAAALMDIAEQDLFIAARDNELTLLCQADAPDFPRDLKRQLSRAHGKGPSLSRFMTGRMYRSIVPRAGLHIHFGTERKLGSGKHERTVVDLSDMPEVVRLLDKAFGKIIKGAKRIPGEYEVKGHGFEYRSLPANVNLKIVVPVLQEIQKSL